MEHRHYARNFIITILAIGFAAWFFFPHFQSALDEKSAGGAISRDNTPSPTSGEERGVSVSSSGSNNNAGEQVVEVYHKFRDGWHTYTGTVLVDDSCTTVSTQATVLRGAAPHAIISLRPQQEAGSGSCVKEPTPQSFMVSFPATPALTVEARLNATPLTLNVRETPAGEDPRPTVQ